MKWSAVEVFLSVILVTIPTLDFLLVYLVPNRVLGWFRDKDAVREIIRRGSEADDPDLLERKFPDEDKLNFIAELDPRTRKEAITSAAYITTEKHNKHNEQSEMREHDFDMEDIKEKLKQYKGDADTAQPHGESERHLSSGHFEDVDMQTEQTGRSRAATDESLNPHRNSLSWLSVSSR
jgi:hypothetical protein